jgi:hypothetical protein
MGSKYVALLRGINVGGKNLIKTTALAACFEQHGFQLVARRSTDSAERRPRARSEQR